MKKIRQSAANLLGHPRPSSKHNVEWMVSEFFGDRFVGKKVIRTYKSRPPEVGKICLHTFDSDL
jgi:hypothetical protein